MKRITIAAMLYLLAGCAKQEEEQDFLALGMIVFNPSHRVVVWINDEPAKVILPGEGGVIPLRVVADEGKNHAWVSVERADGEEGSVTVEIKEGAWTEPEKIIEHFYWDSSADAEQSPKFSFTQSCRLGSDRSKLQAITVSETEAAEIAREKHAILEGALQRRDTGRSDLEREL